MNYITFLFGVCISINVLAAQTQPSSETEDPRIPYKEYTEEKSNEILEKFNSLKNEKQICANKFIKDYQNKVFEHCMKEGYAENIGGGCYHVVGYAIHTAVLEKALNKCNIKI